MPYTKAMHSSFRISVIAACFFTCAFLIIARLFYWQIIMGNDLSTQASNQRQSISKQKPIRGSILASDGFPLAINKEGYLLWANPKEATQEPQLVAQALAPILAPNWQEIKIASDSSQAEIDDLLETEQKNTYNFLLSQLSKKDLVWVLLNKKTTKEEKAQIDNLKFEGLYFDEEAIRIYPEASMAASTIGFLGQDEHGDSLGYFGLEGFYELDLTGRIGILKQEKDALFRPIPIGKFWAQKKKDGRHLQLYLDRTIQFLVEEKLKSAVDRYQAKSGTAVIMNPKTGGIIAIASYPSFNPNYFYTYDPGSYIDPIVSLAYEPGSTFKVLNMAAALEENLITPETQCDICGEAFKIDKYTIRTWNDKYYPNSTMTEVLAHSDNVGMVYVAKKLGLEKFIKYLDLFGIGQKTNIDLQGEIAPSLRQNWSEVDLYTASFGQGLLVTPIQILTAVSAIANDGQLMMPRIVNKFIESGKDYDIKTKAVRQVISKNTADILTEMMVAAVDYGDAKWVVPDGYRIAGKTGTAQISVGGEYDERKTIASFVGFAPADDPAFVMLTIIQEPLTSEWGSETAAPLFFDIAKKLFVYLGIPAED